MGDLDRHLLVFGKLKLPPGGVARWRELATDPEAIADWPELLEGGHLPAGSVGDALDAFVALDGANGDLGLRVKGASVTLAGFLLQPGTLTWSRDVAAALARASEVGANAAPPEGPAPLLRADLPNTFGKPLLYEVLASLRAAGTTEQVAAHFDQLVARSDRDGDNALARITGALLQRGALDPARATAVAERLPDQFGALRPAG